MFHVSLLSCLKFHESRFIYKKKTVHYFKNNEYDCRNFLYYKSKWAYGPPDGKWILYPPTDLSMLVTLGLLQACWRLYLLALSQNSGYLMHYSPYRNKLLWSSIIQLLSFARLIFPQSHCSKFWSWYIPLY